jgi:hypothetical protein
MKRVIFIFAVLVIAFCAMVAGFSSYSDAVTIDAHTTTGTLAMGIACRNALSDGSQLFPDLQAASPQQSGQAPLPAGTITTSDGNLKGSIDGISYFDGLTINAYNCHFGFGPGLQLEIANVGTLPARVSELDFDWGYLSNIVPLCNWSFIQPDGVLARGTDVQSLQEALEQVIIKPQERLDLAVQMQFTGDVDEGVCAVGMQYDRWNVDTP